MSEDFAKLSRLILAEETQKCIDENREKIIRNTEKRLQALNHNVNLDAAEIAMEISKKVKASDEPTL